MLINLRHFYPFYTQDCFIEVDDQVAELMYSLERAEEALKRKQRDHHAYYSLDRNDGIENSIIFSSHSLEENYERKLTNQELHTVISLLPDKQAKRIYARYFLGLSSKEIAESERVSPHSVNLSIRKGLERLEKLLKNQNF